jgi:hypothetical protein
MPEISDQFVTERELAIIEAAYVVVMEWIRDHQRRSFRQTILERAKPALVQYGLTASDYPAFRRVANAIRTGQGHPDTNPGPLIVATRDLPDISITWE